MTVCIAAMCNNLSGVKAIITASDRMITGSGGQIEYEPPQLKMSFLTPRSVLLIAGTFQIHSEAILKTKMRLQSQPHGSLEEIAEIYGGYIRKIRLRYAEQTHLSPWNLTMETFLQKESSLSPSFSSSLIRDLENFPIQDCEAIIAGCDDISSHLYHVDSLGRVSCHDDIGFLAIGLGANHAQSLFMQGKYANTWKYPNTLLITYAAKRKAEIAPGVGKHTDMYYIDKTGVAPVVKEFFAETEKVYEDFQKKSNAQAAESVNALTKFITEFKPPKKEDPKNSTEKTSKGSKG